MEQGTNIVKHTAELATLMCEKIRDSGLVASTKTVVLSPKAQHAADVQRRPAAAGISISQTSRARDLGVDAGAGARRAVSVSNKRLRYAQRKTSRLGILRKTAAKGVRTQNIYASNIWPTQNYGLAAYGMPPRHLAAARTTLARSVAARHGQCPIATAAIAFSHLGRDPIVAHIKELISFWCAHWHGLNDHMKEQTRKVWRESYHLIKDFNTNAPHRVWSRVRGPMRALLKSLLDFSWEPIQPDYWISYDEKGPWHHRTNELEPGTDVFHAAAMSAELKLMSTVAGHYAGGGSIGGLYWPAVHRHIAHLRATERLQSA
jgi:hypothetical protein